MLAWIILVQHVSASNKKGKVRPHTLVILGVLIAVFQRQSNMPEIDKYQSDAYSRDRLKIKKYNTETLHPRTIMLQRDR
jgi:hypothetical protein